MTGTEDDNENKRRNDGRDIVSKTKLNPTQKMQTIHGFFNLINSNDHKEIKLRDGKIKVLKSSKDIMEEWGINIGNNLTFTGRIISQPHVLFEKNKVVNPRNGLFRAENPFASNELTNDNIFFLYFKSISLLILFSNFFNSGFRCSSWGSNFSTGNSACSCSYS